MNLRPKVTLSFVAALAVSPLAWPLSIGDKAPDCAARTIPGGATLNLGDYRGKVLYLDFWASWCGPCQESFPFMNTLDGEFRKEGLAIVAVGVDKTAEDAQRFLARYPPQFSLALDVAGVCPAAYQLPGMPTSFLIDRAGVIRAVHSGFRPSDAAEIRRQIAEALAHR